MKTFHGMVLVARANAELLGFTGKAKKEFMRTVVDNTMKLVK